VRRLRLLPLLPLPPLQPLLLPRLILMMMTLPLLFSAPCERSQPLLLDERQLGLGRSHWRQLGGGKKWTGSWRVRDRVCGTGRGRGKRVVPNWFN